MAVRGNLQIFSYQESFRKKYVHKATNITLLLHNTGIINYSRRFGTSSKQTSRYFKPEASLEKLGIVDNFPVVTVNVPWCYTGIGIYMIY